MLLVYDVIQSEPRGHAEKKKSNNLLQLKYGSLTSFRSPVVLNGHNFLLQLLYATHQGFAISQRTHLTQVSITLL